MDCAHGFRLVSEKGQRSSVTEQADFWRVGSVLTHWCGVYRKCRGLRKDNEAFQRLRGDLGCREISGFMSPKSGQGGTGRSGSRLRDRHRISNRSSGWFLLFRCYRGYVTRVRSLPENKPSLLCCRGGFSQLFRSRPGRRILSKEAWA